MKNAKFWLAQIAMIAIVSLVLGSPAFAGPPNNTKGVDTKNANASEKAKENANENAGFTGEETTAEENPVVEETVCVIDPNNILGSCL